MTVVSVCGGAAVVDATSIPEEKKHNTEDDTQNLYVKITCTKCGITTIYS